MASVDARFQDVVDEASIPIQNKLSESREGTQTNLEGFKSRTVTEGNDAMYE